MRDFFRSFMKAGVPYGCVMGGIYAVFKGIFAGIIMGGLAGILFGLIMSLFVMRQKKKFENIRKEITSEKQVIFDGAANHLKGKEAVGGWLFLTDKELVFKSHSFNIQNHQTVIPLMEISEVKTSRMLWIFPTAIRIILTDGVEEKFVVNDRKDWIQKIEELSQMKMRNLL